MSKLLKNVVRNTPAGRAVRVLKGDMSGLNPLKGGVIGLLRKKKASGIPLTADEQMKLDAGMACGGRTKMKAGGKTSCRGMGAATKGGKYKGR